MIRVSSCQTCGKPIRYQSINGGVAKGWIDPEVPGDEGTGLLCALSGDMHVPGLIREVTS